MRENSSFRGYGINFYSTYVKFPVILVFIQWWQVLKYLDSFYQAFNDVFATAHLENSSPAIDSHDDVVIAL